MAMKKKSRTVAIFTKKISCFVMILATFFVVVSDAQDCEARPGRNLQSTVMKPRVIKFHFQDDLLQKENNTAFIIAGLGGNVNAVEAILSGSKWKEYVSSDFWSQKQFENI